MRGIYLQLKLNLHLYVLNYGIVKNGLLTSHIGYFCTLVSLEISFLFCLKNNSFTWHGIPLSNCGRGLFFFFVPSTNGPSGCTGRPSGASTVRCWRRGYRRCRRRVAGLLGVRIRARVRIRVQSLVLSGMAGAGRRAIAALAAGLVSAARSAAAPLPRSFSLQAQGPGLARRIPALLSCFQARRPRHH
jgi:hypothetical protein